MNENKNELQSSDSSSPEALKRAERIKAIKNSIRNKTEESAKAVQENTSPDAESAELTPEELYIEPYFTKIASESEEGQSDVNEENAEITREEVAVEETGASAQSAESEWENELAERIAKRVQKVKSDKQRAVSGEVPEQITAEADEISEEPAEVMCDETDNTVSEENGTDVQEAQTEAGEAVNEPETAEKPAKKTGGKKKKKKKKKKKTLKESLLGLLPQKGDGIAERIRKVVFLGSCCAIIVCGYIVVDYYIDTTHTEKGYEDIMSDYIETPTKEKAETPEIYDGEYYELLPGAEKLLDINEEVVGVIRIPDTKVNYPVVQSGDLEKYLDKNIMGEDAKAGSLFLDYRNRFDHVVDGKLTEPNSDNLIIYGHNMGNGMMFGSLKNYRNNVNYYEEHPIIELNSNYACYKYKIFAFFIIDADDKTETVFDCWNYLNFNTETDFYNYVNEVKKRTIRLTNVDVKYGDKLLTLSTCNSIFGQGGGGRLIIMARLVRDGEDLYEGTTGSVPNPNIKWPTLYYKYNKGEEYDPNAEFIPYNAETTTATEENETTEE
ncbi:MAG: class B sortase [Ruminococcus sp.]|nr:class B sortase [Ruminococcus sp.]